MQARRARTLLYLIENRTAYLAARSKRAMALYDSEEGERKQYLDFLESFALGKDPPIRPSIQDIERYAPEWAPLLPDNPALRAALLYALGQKYRFNYRSIPGIRAAAGLDAPEVAAAFSRAHGKSAEEQFSAPVSVRERLGYASSRVSTSLETLPPFWAVFALTLTETVGSGVLALPIAMAKVGPAAGVALLIVIGLINVITIAAMAETVTRTGSVRYGGSYFGRIVTGYLGTAGASVMTVALASIFFLGLVSYYLGLASTLYSSTGIVPELWAALLFVTAIYFLSRGSLDSTIASALVVGAVNVLLVFALCVLAFSRMNPGLLGYINLPFVDGRPFDPSVLELVFGVVLCTYFGHTSVGNCGKLVLRRDPSGRSLIWGVVCAELAAMLLFCVWVVAVNGAVPTEILISEKGTSLSPLATVVGPVVHPIGSIFVLLAMGMTSIHFSLGLFNLVKERLPRLAPRVAAHERQLTAGAGIAI
ncbi:MAG TPA: aromatic amino acid transport family protein [Chloroflexota bacterium]|nr:aromatic amino acid transport family protein [Chloroflexota bacterium]